MSADNEANHPWYGPCDGFGPYGSCSVCSNVLVRADGSWITQDGSGTVIKKAPLIVRLRRAWMALRGGYEELVGRS